PEHPRHCVAHGLGRGAVVDLAARTLRVDEPRLAERLQVLDDCLPGHRQPAGELTRGRRAPVQELAHDRATRAVGERSEDAVERVVSTAHRWRALVPRTRHRSATWELRSSASLRSSLMRALVPRARHRSATWELRSSASLRSSLMRALV